MILFLIFSPYLILGQTHQVYNSIGYEQQGLTEYIEYSLKYGHIKYWTSENPDKIILFYENMGILGNEQKVSFPNSQAIYKLELDGYTLLFCTHPNEEKQVFNILPDTYYSKDFEKKGITEYLICEGFFNQNEYTKEWYYTTSQNPNQKVKLEFVGDGSENMSESYGLKFPNDNRIYTYSKPASCERRFDIIHPDGRKQTFKAYYFDGALK